MAVGSATRALAAGAESAEVPALTVYEGKTRLHAPWPRFTGGAGARADEEGFCASGLRPPQYDESTCKAHARRELSKTAMAKILIVEDDVIVATDNARTLEAAGHEVVGVAVTFEEAFVTASDTRPDLAIVDLKLANAIDGITVGRELVKRYKVRCLFATAFAEQVEKHAGDFTYTLLAKPYTSDELLPAVQTCLERAS